MPKILENSKQSPIQKYSQLNCGAAKWKAVIPHKVSTANRNIICTRKKFQTIIIQYIHMVTEPFG